MASEQDNDRQGADGAAGKGANEVANDVDRAAALAAEKLGDPAFQAKLRELSPQQIELFVAALQMAIRKRRLMLLGYLCALLSIVLGLVFALITYAGHDRGTFVGWVFFVPFALAGASMWLFGKLARRIHVRVGDLEIDTDARSARPRRAARGADR
jgi:hypothetical protein